jgi:N-glycosylase/DNA lyase
MVMTDDRIDAVAGAIAALGHDGITAFDREEPEYDPLQTIDDRADSDPHVALLGICAGVVDYQLAGDAQRFWPAFEHVTLEHGPPGSVTEVQDVLATFMDQTVNARLNSQKRMRLAKLFDSGFADWFVDHHDRALPIEVWDRVADALDNRMSKKTVVMAMKVYDVLHLIRTDEYLDLPIDIPVPCDLQVQKVARTSGIVMDDDDASVMNAWGAVTERVNEHLDTPVSMLRVDSIVWQAGQQIDEADFEGSRTTLERYFTSIGIDDDHADRLAREFVGSTPDVE